MQSQSTTRSSRGPSELLAIRDWQKKTPAQIQEEVAAAIQIQIPNVVFVQNEKLVERVGGDLRPMSVDRLSALVDQSVYLATYASEDSTIVKRAQRVCRHDVRAILAAPELHAPRIVLARAHPLMRPDGGWPNAAGYDPITQTFWYWPSAVDFPQVESADANRAIRSILFSFRYATPSSALNALSMLIRPVVQLAYEGPSPEGLVSAWRKGAGKTFFIEAVSWTLNDHGPRFIPPAASENEAQWAAAAVLQSQPPIALFDNVRTGSTVGGANRHAMLTARGLFPVRPVGSAQTLFKPAHVQFAATGNSLDVDDEHSRRSLFICLASPKCPHDFPDLLGHLRRYRPYYLACLCRIASDWILAGCPPPPRSLPSFQGWAAVVGGIACFTLPEYRDAWLHPDSRPMPAVDREWGLLFETWPQANGRADRLRPTHILALVDAADMPHLARLAGSGSDQSRVTRFAMKLSSLSASGRAFRKFTLHAEASGNNKFYRPEPDGADRADR